jgi:hypothetical protein
MAKSFSYINSVGNAPPVMQGYMGTEDDAKYGKVFFPILTLWEMRVLYGGLDRAQLYKDILLCVYCR